jgi:membrane-associated phospholipid phosphatase
MSVTGLKSATVAPTAPWRWFLANITGGLALLCRPRKTTVASAWRASRRLAGGTLMISAVIVATMLLLDRTAIVAAQGLPGWLVHAFDQITDFGRSNWFLVPIGFLLLLIAVVASPALKPVSRLVLAALAVRLAFVFTAIAVPGLFDTIVKRLIGRARPFVGGEADPFLYMPFAWRPEYASLPSGHATNVFAALVAIALVWPRLRVVMLVYALIIAASRVIVLAHHPSDVIAGAAVGAVGALIVRDWFAARRLGFAVGADGRVQALPGPSLRRIKNIARQLVAS